MLGSPVKILSELHMINAGAFWELHDISVETKGNRANCIQLNAYGQDILRVFDAEGTPLPFLCDVSKDLPKHWKNLSSQMMEHANKVLLPAKQRAPILLSLSSSILKESILPCCKETLHRSSAVESHRRCGLCRKAIILCPRRDYQQSDDVHRSRHQAHERQCPAR